MNRFYSLFNRKVSFYIFVLALALVFVGNLQLASATMSKRQITSSQIAAGPLGIAVNQVNGDVYATTWDDSQNYYVEKYDQDGNFVTKWQYAQGFNYFAGIAVDSVGNVYAADFQDSVVKKFDANGNFLAQWGNNEFNFGPFSVAVQGTTVYATEIDGSEGVISVKEFDLNGNFLGWFGDSSNSFIFAISIAVDPSSTQGIYTANNGLLSSGGNVDQFSDSGQLVKTWGSFQFPSGIGVNSQANYVYVADSGADRIFAFDTSGNQLFSWGGPGNGKGQLNEPIGVGINQSSGNVYVADNANNRVQVFDSKGDFLNMWNTDV